MLKVRPTNGATWRGHNKKAMFKDYGKTQVAHTRQTAPAPKPAIYGNDPYISPIGAARLSQRVPAGSMGIEMAIPERVGSWTMSVAPSTAARQSLPGAGLQMQGMASRGLQDLVSPVRVTSPQLAPRYPIGPRPMSGIDQLPQTLTDFHRNPAAPSINIELFRKVINDILT